MLMTNEVGMFAVNPVVAIVACCLMCPSVIVSSITALKLTSDPSVWADKKETVLFLLEINTTYI